ncbi:polysaccharide export protein [Salinisphaera dokdonensis CL-ES53]|uniref:Polysaccharide export protein n=1 Tax=Salinisphaera dokdonensis CL-ES53 TaxID=1304272 RepID=A0ABV2B546_9GAMM
MVFAALALMVLGACATPPPQPVGETAQAPDYRIGPGDGLRIHVRNNPDLSMSVPVRPDGNISIPLVEQMTAAGKNPIELADDLETALSAYIRDPLVTVIVTSFVGTYEDQVRVVGEAARPQSMPYRRGMTLLDVMINVGGLTQFAAGNRARLVREVSGEQKTYGLQLQGLLGGDIASNVAMQPGDVVIIPRTMF